MPFYMINGARVHVRFSGRLAKNPPKPCAFCGGLSGYLCDEPVAPDGRTCDLPLCETCRTSVGADLDRCPTHAKTPFSPAQGQLFRAGEP